MYNIQNHWVPGIWPASGILNIQENNVSGEKKGSVSEVSCF
jgi:hypothetical protein